MCYKYQARWSCTIGLRRVSWLSHVTSTRSWRPLASALSREKATRRRTWSQCPANHRCKWMWVCWTMACLDLLKYFWSISPGWSCYHHTTATTRHDLVIASTGINQNELGCQMSRHLAVFKLPKGWEVEPPNCFLNLLTHCQIMN